MLKTIRYWASIRKCNKEIKLSRAFNRNSTGWFVLSTSKLTREQTKYLENYYSSYSMDIRYGCNEIDCVLSCYKPIECQRTCCKIDIGF